MPQERRRFSRVSCYVPVRLFQDDPRHVLETLTKDLGPGGLRCLSPVFKPVSTPIVLELTLGAGEKPLGLRGQIVWFKIAPKSEQFDLGISFDSVSERDEAFLSSYIQRISHVTVRQSS